MKNRMITMAICCVLAFCLMMSSMLTVSAANPEHLVTLDKSQTISVAVWYDVSFPTVKLTKPDGSVIHVKQGAAGINLTVEAEWALIEVPSAAAGKWMIEIDKGANTDVSYQLMNATENIWIQYLRVKTDERGRLQATFLAERGDERTSYQYELYLTTSSADAGEKLLKEGSATTGEETTLTLDMGEQPSHDDYVLFLRVYKVLDGYELFDECESASFQYTNPDTPAAPAGLDVSVEIADRMLTCDWSSHKAHRFDSYFIEVTAEGASEVLFFNEFDAAAEQMTCYLNADYSVFTVTFYGRDNGVLSTPVTRKVRLEGDGYIQILTPELTSQGQAQIKMDLPAQTEMTVKNGEEETVFTSKGEADTVAVMLQNGSNEVVASAVVNDVQYVFERTVFKDGTPPALTFFELYDGMKFMQKTVTVVGNVSGGVSLTVGDKDVTLDDYGNFSVDVTIEAGENAIEFIAQDAAGNQTARTLYMHGAMAANLAEAIEQFVSNNMAVVVAAVIGLATLIAAVVLLLCQKKLKVFSFVTLIVVWALVIAVMATGLTLSIVNLVTLSSTVESMGFSEMVDNDISEAVATLDAYEAAPDQVWLWAILTAVAVVGLAVTITVHYLLKNKKDKETVEQETAQ